MDRRKQVYIVVGICLLLGLVGGLVWGFADLGMWRGLVGKLALLFLGVAAVTLFSLLRTRH